MKKIFNIKKEIPHLVVLGLIIALLVFTYPMLSNTIPTHWNISGQIDATDSKAVAIPGLAAMVIGIYALLSVVPYLDPKREKYGQFIGIYRLFKLAIISFFGLVCLFIVLSGLGYSLPVGVLIPVSVGVLFMFIGNFFGKLKQNYFIGIRLPWTLANEDNWNKTHRFGGKVFFIGGLLLVIAGAASSEIGVSIFLATITFIIIAPVIYSWRISLSEK